MSTALTVLLWIIIVALTASVLFLLVAAIRYHRINKAVKKAAKKVLDETFKEMKDDDFWNI